MDELVHAVRARVRARRAVSGTLLVDAARAGAFALRLDVDPDALSPLELREGLRVPQARAGVLRELRSARPRHELVVPAVHELTAGQWLEDGLHRDAGVREVGDLPFGHQFIERGIREQLVREDVARRGRVVLHDGEHRRFIRGDSRAAVLELVRPGEAPRHARGGRCRRCRRRTCALRDQVGRILPRLEHAQLLVVERLVRLRRQRGPDPPRVDADRFLVVRFRPGHDLRLRLREGVAGDGRIRQRYRLEAAASCGRGCRGRCGAGGGGTGGIRRLLLSRTGGGEQHEQGGLEHDDKATSGHLSPPCCEWTRVDGLRSVPILQGIHTERRISGPRRQECLRSTAGVVERRHSCLRPVALKKGSPAFARLPFRS